MSVYTDAFEAIVAAGAGGKVYEVAVDKSADGRGQLDPYVAYVVAASKAQAALEVVGEDKVHLLTKADKNEILIKKLAQDAKEKAGV